MKVYKRVCLKDEEFVDDRDPKKRTSLIKDHEYTTSRIWEDGTLTVFTGFWFRVSPDLFGPAVEL